MCLNGLRCSQNAAKWQFESTKFQILWGSMSPNPRTLAGANHSCKILDRPLNMVALEVPNANSCKAKHEAFKFERKPLLRCMST